MSVVPEPLAPSCAEGNGGEYNRLLLRRKHTKVFRVTKGQSCDIFIYENLIDLGKIARPG